MDIHVKQDGNKAHISVEGKVDTYTSPELQKTLDELPENTTDIEFDLGSVTYVSSAGLRVLISSARLLSDGKKPVLHNITDFVKETMEMTGILELFDVM